MRQSESAQGDTFEQYLQTKDLQSNSPFRRCVTCCLQAVIYKTSSKRGHRERRLPSTASHNTPYALSSPPYSFTYPCKWTCCYPATCAWGRHTAAAKCDKVTRFVAVSLRLLCTWSCCHCARLLLLPPNYTLKPGLPIAVPTDPSTLQSSVDSLTMHLVSFICCVSVGASADPG